MSVVPTAGQGPGRRRACVRACVRVYFPQEDKAGELSTQISKDTSNPNETKTPPIHNPQETGCRISQAAGKNRAVLRTRSSPRGT